jgi:hypothetical protein
MNLNESKAMYNLQNDIVEALENAARANHSVMELCAELSAKARDQLIVENTDLKKQSEELSRRNIYLEGLRQNLLNKCSSLEKEVEQQEDVISGLLTYPLTKKKRK